MKTRPNLLLVDDDLGAMRYISMALEDAGYRVTQVCTVADAIDFLKTYSQTVDGVILDVMLPLGRMFPTKQVADGMSGGNEVFRYLQSAHPGIPVLVLSSVSSESLLKEFASSDSVQVAGKLDHSPFDIVTLVNRLVGIIPSSRNKAQSEEAP
jgi:CheY-like chemotaxis protein